MALFEKGQPKMGGRRKGVKDRLSTTVLQALLDDFAEFGVEAVKFARLERPVEYLRICASLIPREFEITTHNSLAELSDGELDEYIAKLRAERAAAGSSDSREEPTIN
jgi:hypothetical protein